jgi:peptidyl-prolyl cis-trans isomerase A (cyclophilin A)
MTADLNIPGDGTLFADIETSLGTLTVQLFEKETPNTVANFVGLATGSKAWTDPRTGQPGQGPYYDNTIFHRVIPGFMVQCGDPTGTGRGGPGYRFADEFHPNLRHDRAGILSMANAGPGTNGSQFFITEGPTPHLDKRHSVFGAVTKGLDIVGRIANVPRDRGDRPLENVVLKSVRIYRA